MNDFNQYNVKVEQQPISDPSFDEAAKERKACIISVIVYIAILFVLASFIAYAIGVALCKQYKLDLFTFMECLAATDFTPYDPVYLRVSALCQGWANLLAYLICAVIICIVGYKIFVNDFKRILEKPLKFLGYVAITGIGFLVITTLVSILFGFFIEDSTNQDTIEMIIGNGGAPTMIISVVLLAPIVEEFVYRKAIFNFMKKYGPVACYAISIILFTLPHMISTDASNILNWLLTCIPYAFSGFLLCLIYHKSNENIYASIAVHMLNNILACILMFV